MIRIWRLEDLLIEFSVGILGIISGVYDTWVGDPSAPFFVIVSRMCGILAMFVYVLVLTILAFAKVDTETSFILLASIIFAITATSAIFANVSWEVCDVFSMIPITIRKSYTAPTVPIVEGGNPIVPPPRYTVQIPQMSIFTVDYWKWFKDIFCKLMIHNYTYQSSMYTTFFPYIYLKSNVENRTMKHIFVFFILFVLGIPPWILHMISVIIEHFIYTHGCVIIAFCIPRYIHVLNGLGRREGDHVLEDLICSTNCIHIERPHGHKNLKRFKNLMSECCQEKRHELEVRNILWFRPDDDIHISLRMILVGICTGRVN